MTKVKDIFIILACMVILAPCLLMFDKSNGVINIIGILYLLLVVALSFTKCAKRFVRRCYKANLRLEKDLLNLKML